MNIPQKQCSSNRDSSYDILCVGDNFISDIHYIYYTTSCGIKKWCLMKAQPCRYSIHIECCFQVHLKTEKNIPYLGSVFVAEKFRLNYTGVHQLLKLDYFNLAVRREYIKQKKRIFVSH